MSNTPDRTGLRWVKSSYSGNGGGTCLEWAPDVAATSRLVPVRDSKNPEGPSITFTAEGWTRFLRYARVQGI
jgi:hypothetical protein